MLQEFKMGAPVGRSSPATSRMTGSRCREQAYQHPSLFLNITTVVWEITYMIQRRLYWEGDKQYSVCALIGQAVFSISYWPRMEVCLQFRNMQLLVRAFSAEFLRDTYFRVFKRFINRELYTSQDLILTFTNWNITTFISALVLILFSFQAIKFKKLWKTGLN